MKWELLRLAAEHIERDFRTFDIEVYGQRTACGTVACVAGHILWASDPQGFFDAIKGIGDDVEDRATALLAPDDRSQHEDILYYLFLAHPLDFDEINQKKRLVPSALRWMADNRSFDWRAAFEAVQ